jgi:sulfur-oxidizing protein SoxY
MTNVVRALKRPLSRRDVVAGVATVGAVACVAPMAAFATPAQVEEEVKKASGGKPLAEGKIKLDLPSIAENGLVVPLGFDIESPMTDKDYVKTVTFFAEGNPNPILASFHFTPLIPKASGQIRIRLAATQNIVAVAEMSDGKLYTAKKEVKVTIGGCGG